MEGSHSGLVHTLGKRAYRKVSGVRISLPPPLVIVSCEVMSTSPETVSFILKTLDHTTRFTSRAMFGEYALYADGKVVALICDDQLYVKIHPATEVLSTLCDQDSPYPGAKPHYLITEEQVRTIRNLPIILFSLATALPKKVTKNKTPRNTIR